MEYQTKLNEKYTSDHTVFQVLKVYMYIHLKESYKISARYQFLFVAVLHQLLFASPDNHFLLLFRTSFNII